MADTVNLETPHALEFTLNGRAVRIQEISPNTTLLEYLRGNGLTGTKEGCAEGDCGACSVAILEPGPDGLPAYRAVNSCLLPICLLAGREVVTVEGIGCARHPHPVQVAMVSHLGSQCGYCTPGFICSLFEGYYRHDLHSESDLDEQLSGNLCRCTGYRPIRDAAGEAFSTQDRPGHKPPHSVEDAFAGRLKNAVVKPGAANYESHGEKFIRPVSLAGLFSSLAANPGATLIAGATELGLDITKRYHKFSTLISTEAVAELKQVECTKNEWQIGAAVTLTEISDRLGGEFPMLADMLRVFGSRQIRNRATMGGNLVTASPIGDSAPVLLASDAKVVLASPARERVLSIGEFFIAYRRTALQPGEILKAIVIPRGISGPGVTRKSAWFKVSKRREMDISTVAGAFVLDLDSQNIVRHVRLGFGGVAAMPVRAGKTEAALLGRPWTETTLQAVLAILRAEFAPISDVRGSAEYRSGLVTGLLEKFYFDTSAGIASPPHSHFALRAPRSTLPVVPHESAHKHVTGEAIYTDDFAARRTMLEVWPLCAPHARAKILRRDASAAKTMPGIKAVLLAEDVPGLNDVGAVRNDEILLADQEVFYHGQIIALVVGDTQEACRNAAAKIVVEYDLLPPILKIEDAIAQNSFHTEPNFIRRGDIHSALNNSPQVLAGEFYMAGQEHFYLEMQAAWAEQGEDSSMFVMSSTQHPSEVQHIVAHLLHVRAQGLGISLESLPLLRIECELCSYPLQPLRWARRLRGRLETGPQRSGDKTQIQHQG